MALPLEAINKAAAREKSIRHGHPSTLHLWWARRPLAAARAVIFAQMVDDPSANPDLFPTAKAQEKERQRLFKIIEELVPWENTTNEAVLERARVEIWQSWRRACADNADHPRAKELFNRDKLPAFYDPFAGGGALPLEAQRLGLEVFASDLNPVAVLINKATLEILPRFAAQQPVNPGQKQRLQIKPTTSNGIAEDVRFYGNWIREEANRKIGSLYPAIEVTSDLASGRPDLKGHVGKKVTPVAWLWARTVRSPNPAFAEVHVPLVSNYVVSAKKDRAIWVEPIVGNKACEFSVRTGKPKDAADAKTGTKISRGSFRCILSGVPIPYEYIDAEANEGRMGARLMTIVAEGERGRLYLPPIPAQETIALSVKPVWKPDAPSRGTWASNAQGRRYGFRTFGDYFSSRQSAALLTFADLLNDARARIKQDALDRGLKDDGRSLEGGGTGASAYADAVVVFLSFALSKLADYATTLCRWFPERDSARSTFSRQAISMSWDYTELNPLHDATGSFRNGFVWVAECIGELALQQSHSKSAPATVLQLDASTQDLGNGRVISTDPPYYDNIGYADLSDFFYVWLRRALRLVFPELFSTVGTPKAEELVACSYRHGSKEAAESFFLEGMTRVAQRLAEQQHPAFPISIYYAFRQSESGGPSGDTRTGWETFLDALIRAGFAISGTWPMRTELGNRMIGNDANVLASSIVLVCHPRPKNAAVVSQREFLAAIRSELPKALGHLQRSNIAPVDLAQAAIGPGMAVFTRSASVLNPSGKPLSVREALQAINQVLDEVLADQEGDFDPDSRWALAWFEQFGFGEGEFGVAETLSKAKNTSVDGLVTAGFLSSKRGRVRLLSPDDLPEDWDPTKGERLSVWEMTHHLIRVLEAGGENAAAQLVERLGPPSETSRDLAYRLYAICERKKRAPEALRYNALVQSWPEIQRLAREAKTPKAEQTSMFEE